MAGQDFERITRSLIDDLGPISPEIVVGSRTYRMDLDSPMQFMEQVGGLIRQTIVGNGLTYSDLNDSFQKAANLITEALNSHIDSTNSAIRRFDILAVHGPERLSAIVGVKGSRRVCDLKTGQVAVGRLAEISYERNPIKNLTDLYKYGYINTDGKTSNGYARIGPHLILSELVIVDGLGEAINDTDFSGRVAVPLCSRKLQFTKQSLIPES